MSAAPKKSPHPSRKRDPLRRDESVAQESRFTPDPTAEPVAPSSVPGDRRPWSVTVTALIVLIEALAVIAAAIVQFLDLGSPSPISMAGRIFLPVLLLGVGAWQIMVGAKHWAGRAWTRAAVVVWQLFQIILSIQYLVSAPSVGDWLGFLFGVGLFVPGAIALVLVFSPSTRAFLEADDRAAAERRG